MKRLTDSGNKEFRGHRIYDRLAAYEDTGYTPEEIAVLKEQCHRLEDALSAAIDDKKRFENKVASLKAENENLKETIQEMRARIQWENDPGTNRALAIENDRLKAENERLVFLINKHPLKPIEDCKHYKECYSKAYDHTKPMGCISCDKWELGELEAENGQD